MDTEMALPIKRGNQVIPVTRKAKRKAVDDEDVNEKIIADDDEMEQSDDDEKKPPADEERKKQVKTDLEIDLTIKSPAEQMAIKMQIAEMCTAITANPEESVLKKGGKAAPSAANPDFMTYSLKDLLGRTATKDPMELELVLMSITLVFKDICPGYRIRSAIEASKDENGNSIQLKKETKKLFDFERNLLHYYQQFLYILDKRASWGLLYLSKGKSVDATLSPAHRAVKQSLGLTALRCQCELLRGLVHFNFRSMLLNSVLSRASAMSIHAGQEDDLTAQVQRDVVNIVAEALEFIIRYDTTGEVSYELVMLMNKLLKVTKTTLAPRILQCLEAVKVTVKADDAMFLKMKSKQEKKKRKNDDSKVEAGLIEANLVNDDVSKKRFQVNSLQEMSLLYFRILKMKPTEPNQQILLPMALAGLGRITHLINVDHVVDLMTILRGLLDLGAAISVSVRLLCVVCALKTLSGPGELLQIDDEPYLKHLHQVMMDIPKTFDHWIALYDCVDVYFVQRREDKMPLVEKTIILLTILATSHVDSLVGSVLLTLAHSLLLRYPRARQSMALWQYGVLLLSAASGPADILSGKVRVRIIESAAAAAALLVANQRTALASVTDAGQTPDEEHFFEEDGRMEDLAMRGLVDGAAVSLSAGKHSKKATSGGGAGGGATTKVKKTKQQKKFAQRAHSSDPAIANMYATWEQIQGLDIREQMVRLLAMILVRSDARQDQPRFRRIVNAMCQQELVPLPLIREDLDGTADEIMQRSLKYVGKGGPIASHKAMATVAKAMNSAALEPPRESRRVVSFEDGRRQDSDDDDEGDDGGAAEDEDDNGGPRRGRQQKGKHAHGAKKGGKVASSAHHKHDSKQNFKGDRKDFNNNKHHDKGGFSHKGGDSKGGFNKGGFNKGGNSKGGFNKGGSKGGSHQHKQNGNGNHRSGNGGSSSSGSNNKRTYHNKRR
jgi:hypothetical protein